MFKNESKTNLNPFFKPKLKPKMFLLKWVPGNGLAVAVARGARLDGRAPLQPGDVAPQDVHDDRLGDVVRVVAGWKIGRNSA